MPLDPHAKRFLDMAAAAGVRDVATLTPQELRRAFRQLSQMVDRRPVSVGQIINGTLPGAGGDVGYRLYTPIGSVPALIPGLIYFHGGGWIFGDLDTHDGMCRRLCNASGCRVIAIDYRLAPEYRFPAALDDALAAVSWVMGNARDLGIDPDRIAISGDSAGGNLSAVVCRHAVAQGSRIALQVLFCPVLDLGGETESRRNFAAGLSARPQYDRMEPEAISCQ